MLQLSSSTSLAVLALKLGIFELIAYRMLMLCTEAMQSY